MASRIKKLVHRGHKRDSLQDEKDPVSNTQEPRMTSLDISRAHLQQHSPVGKTNTGNRDVDVQDYEEQTATPIWNSHHSRESTIRPVGDSQVIAGSHQPAPTPPPKDSQQPISAVAPGPPSSSAGGQSRRNIESEKKLPVPATNLEGVEQSAQKTIENAQFNSEETHFTKQVAPPVTQETVHHEIHHVWEEQITREEHTHDVYHRILPIVDVEVLPARHFIPIDGGKLIEVNADSMPSRNKNWHIAVPGSQKTSNTALGTSERRRFTAREFPGTEGDAKRYTAPDGHEQTEETWVHPPELETGGRDTGQTWPFEFGDLSLNDTDGRLKSKSRSSGRRKTREATEDRDRPYE